MKRCLRGLVYTVPLVMKRIVFWNVYGGGHLVGWYYTVVVSYTKWVVVIYYAV